MKIKIAIAGVLILGCVALFVFSHFNFGELVTELQPDSYNPEPIEHCSLK